MRGTTLTNLIQNLRRELRMAENPALGKNSRENFAYALRSAQDRLFTANDWPFKIIDRDVTLSAGQRYYGLPADMDMEDLRDVKLFYTGVWWEVRQGIGTEQWNIYNSDADVRCDPVRRWRMYNDPDTNQDMIEVWPIPASNGGFLRFRGVRKLGPLVADADKAELDDTLIVLTAAADICDIKEQKAREAKALQHLFNLKRNLSDGRTFISGGGEDPRDITGQPPRIIIAG